MLLVFFLIPQLQFFFYIFILAFLHFLKPLSVFIHIVQSHCKILKLNCCTLCMLIMNGSVVLQNARLFFFFFLLACFVCNSFFPHSVLFTTFFVACWLITFCSLRLFYCQVKFIVIVLDVRWIID